MWEYGLTDYEYTASGNYDPRQCYTIYFNGAPQFEIDSDDEALARQICARMNE